MISRNKFLKMEQEAFKEAQEQGYSDTEWQPPRPISPETIQGFRAMEKGLDELWSGRHKTKLIKAAKQKQPKRYLGILTDKKPDIVEGATPEGIINI